MFDTSDAQAQDDLTALQKQAKAPVRGDANLEGKLIALQKEYDDLAARTGAAPAKTAAIKKAD